MKVELTEKTSQLIEALQTTAGGVLLNGSLLTAGVDKFIEVAIAYFLLRTAVDDLPDDLFEQICWGDAGELIDWCLLMIENNQIKLSIERN